MKHTFLSFIFLIFLVTEANAYKRYYSSMSRKKKDTYGSLTLSGGPSYCHGDTYGSPYAKSLLDGTNWETGIGFRQMFKGAYGYKASLLVGNYTSNDSPYPRNYASRTSTAELSFRGEYAYNFGGSTRYRTPNRQSVYAFLGLGAVNANITHPIWASTPSYATVKSKNSFIAPFIPVGVGYSIALTDKFSVGAEFKVQYYFSDYIDGYHPVNFSQFNDFTNGVTITLSYKIWGRKGFLDY